MQKIALLTLILGCFTFATHAVGGGGKKAKKKEAARKAAPQVYRAAINIHPNNMVAVQFEKLYDQQVTITIKDEAGKTVRQERVKKHHVMVKKYVLKDVPKGLYTIEVDNGTEVIKKEITVE